MKASVCFLISVVLFLLVACTDGNKRRSTERESATVQQTSTDSHEAAMDPSATLLPAFTVQDVYGGLVNLQSFRGKKVFVNLWATWCPPCRREMPSIQQLARSVDTSKVAFVLISLDDNFNKAKQFVKSKKVNLPIYYPGENLPALFDVLGIPTTFIFNEQGKLIRQINGGDDFNTKKYRELLK